MYLVYDIYQLFSFCRRVLHTVFNITDIIHTVIGCGIDLYNIHGRARRYPFAAGAFPAGTSVRRVFTVHRLCKKLSHGGLACPPCSAEEIGMSHPVMYHLIFQGCYNGFLSLDLLEGLRPELPVQRHICHTSVTLPVKRNH